MKQNDGVRIKQTGGMTLTLNPMKPLGVIVIGILMFTLLYFMWSTPQAGAASTANEERLLQQQVNELKRIADALEVLGGKRPR